MIGAGPVRKSFSLVLAALSMTAVLKSCDLIESSIFGFISKTLIDES
jgi:hypothetical protein